VGALTTSGILLRYTTKNINGAPAAPQILLPELGRVGELLDTARLPPRSMHLDMPLDNLVNDLPCKEHEPYVAFSANAPSLAKQEFSLSLQVVDRGVL
jgi:hypothetical protein